MLPRAYRCFVRQKVADIQHARLINSRRTSNASSACCPLARTWHHPIGLSGGCVAATTAAPRTLEHLGPPPRTAPTLLYSCSAVVYSTGEWRSRIAATCPNRWTRLSRLANARFRSTTAQTIFSRMGRERVAFRECHWHSGADPRYHSAARAE